MKSFFVFLLPVIILVTGCINNNRNDEFNRDKFVKEALETYRNEAMACFFLMDDRNSTESDPVAIKNWLDEKISEQDSLGFRDDLLGLESDGQFGSFEMPNTDLVFLLKFDELTDSEIKILLNDNTLSGFSFEEIKGPDEFYYMYAIIPKKEWTIYGKSLSKQDFFDKKQLQKHTGLVEKMENDDYLAEEMNFTIKYMKNNATILKSGSFLVRLQE